MTSRTAPKRSRGAVVDALGETGFRREREEVWNRVPKHSTADRVSNTETNGLEPTLLTAIIPSSAETSATPIGYFCLNLLAVIRFLTRSVHRNSVQKERTVHHNVPIDGTPGERHTTVRIRFCPTALHLCRHDRYRRTRIGRSRHQHTLQPRSIGSLHSLQFEPKRATMQCFWLEWPPLIVRQSILREFHTDLGRHYRSDKVRFDTRRIPNSCHEKSTRQR